MHTKHSNTFFPGDKVRVTGTKTASLDTGTITGANVDEGKVKVSYADGREDWVSFDQVQKVG